MRDLKSVSASRIREHMFQLASVPGYSRRVTPAPWDTDALHRHARSLAESFRQWTGRALLPLADSPREFTRSLFEAPFVVVSHGIEADPVLNYGNAAALMLWEMSWEELTRTPSRFTAEVPNREERARLLAEVTRHGFIANYAGIRVTKSGRRFRIAQATVWNLIGDDGKPAGQAATFDRWEFL